MPVYTQITYPELLLTLILVIITIGLSYLEKLGLEKDLAISSIRAFVQLTLIGYVLKYIFGLNNGWAVLLMLAIITAIAAGSAAKRGGSIPGSFWISAISIGVGSGLTLGLLVGLGIINHTARYVIPISGMIWGNSMNSTSLVINRMKAEFSLRRLEIENALALGATPGQAISPSMKASARASMIPQINSMITVGLVSLPGMMTGQIIAGVPPQEAVKYQVVVMYMILAAATMTSILTGILTYRVFFTKAYQFKTNLL